jgi:hypothetical protein
MKQIEVGDYEWNNEKLKLKMEINERRIRDWFHKNLDPDVRMRHNTNLKKLEEMEKRESEEWKKKFVSSKQEEGK